MLGQAKLLDTQLPLEELCTPATSNNASVKNHLGVGNRVLSIGTKQHGVNTSYAGIWGVVWKCQLLPGKVIRRWICAPERRKPWSHGKLDSPSAGQLIAKNLSSVG